MAEKRFGILQELSVRLVSKKEGRQKLHRISKILAALGEERI